MEITMEHSESLSGIAKALSQVQAEIRSIKKDSSGYGYKYASISEIMDYALPLLSKNGLAVSQFGGGGRRLITMLIHTETGEYLKGSVDLPSPETMDMKGVNVAQKDGSLRTYYKRYCFCEMIGLTSNDEDTDASSEGPKKANKPAKQEQEGEAPQASRASGFGRK